MSLHHAYCPQWQSIIANLTNRNQEASESTRLDDEFKLFHSQQLEKKITVHALLTEIMQPMIDNRHPQISAIMDTIKNPSIENILIQSGVISKSTCYRLNEVDNEIQQSTIAAMCILLGQNIITAQKIAKAAGRSFKDGAYTDDMYLFLINQFYIKNKDINKPISLTEHAGMIIGCNDFLTRHGEKAWESFLGVDMRAEKKDINNRKKPKIKNNPKDKIS